MPPVFEPTLENLLRNTTMVTYQNFLSHLHHLFGIYSHVVSLKYFKYNTCHVVTFFFITCLVISTSIASAEEEWITLFDGKTLNGWEQVDVDSRYSEKSTWEVIDGALTGTGAPSMLVCTKGPFKNFRYRAEVRINDGGNSGLYFRASRKPDF